MEGISKNRIKLVQSLSKKKERDERGWFVAEGHKLVNDLLMVYPCVMLFATSDYLSKYRGLINTDQVYEVDKKELNQLSLLCAPQSVIAVFEKLHPVIDKTIISKQLSLMLDTIQDPGNLGTIIRIADWFGIENIICSKDTVDVYNPKVVQATMGAMARVKVHYVELEEFLSSLTDIPVYGTFLEGYDIYACDLNPCGVIVMGNEGNGISPSIEKFINKKLYIPNYPKSRETTESLNVAVATAITCSEFRRRMKM